VSGKRPVEDEVEAEAEAEEEPVLQDGSVSCERPVEDQAEEEPMLQDGGVPSCKRPVEDEAEEEPVLRDGGKRPVEDEAESVLQDGGVSDSNGSNATKEDGELRRSVRAKKRKTYGTPSGRSHTGKRRRWNGKREQGGLKNHGPKSLGRLSKLSYEFTNFPTSVCCLTGYSIPIVHSLS
jgi:hypothetical protein